MSKPIHVPAASGDAAVYGSWLPAKQRIMGSLLWPVQGHVRRGFGSQPSGARSDGLDITASEGTLVVAADAGVVTYAGSELQGYGNMLLIAHADGYTTIYAHNQSLLVGVGTEVRRGQPIATVGRTGDVDHPQLHFQLRAGNRPVDPTAYLETKPTIVASLAAAPTAQSGE
ncbi:MAG: murein hydrolase activator EnvC family protein [Geminicoccaceae bacterium]